MDEIVVVVFSLLFYILDGDYCVHSQFIIVLLIVFYCLNVLDVNVSKLNNNIICILWCMQNILE